MPDLTLVMLGAGSSSRFHQKTKKQWLRFGDVPLWFFSTQTLAQLYPFKQIIVTAHPDELAYVKKFSDTIKFVAGGQTRQASLSNALSHVQTSHVLVSDIARPYIDKAMLERILGLWQDADCVVPYLPVVDSVVYETTPINREAIKLIQTPQLSSTSMLQKALQSDICYTDESSAILATGGKIAYVLGDVKAKKLTHKEDLLLFNDLPSPSSNTFVGYGFDVHAYEEGKAMMLCGVEVHPTIGFKAHSDGDVAIHALIDALLGASGAGDIGELFPDTQAQYKGIDSKILLKKVCSFLTSVGFEIMHCDVTIMAEFPKLGPLKNTLRFSLSKLLDLAPHHVNIKATTTEKLGFVGRKEGVATSATVTLKYTNWKDV